MKTIGIDINLQKISDNSLAVTITEWLKSKGCTVLIQEETAEAVGLPGLGVTERYFGEFSDCIIVLGGDGTILRINRLLAMSAKPIVGINLGNVGFLSEIDLPDLIPSLERLLAGDFYIEERMMLEAQVLRDGVLVEETFGLNEVALTNGVFARLFYLETYVNDEFVNIYPANGLVIASPTGSTGYNLAAGGPLVTPDLDLMLITPICPHSLWARPLVVSPDSAVRVKILTAKQEEVMMTMDGQDCFPLLISDQVLVRRADVRARFLRFNERGFFDLLRIKLMEERTRVFDK